MHLGVSPAFYLSAAGKGFSVADMLSAARRAARLGFTAFQLELYRPEAIEEWTDAARAELGRVLDAEGLFPSQFVAHFALEDFSSAASMARKGHREGFRRALDIAASFPACPLVTLPMPPYEPVPREGPDSVRAARAALRGLLAEYLGLARAAGKVLALEIMPHSLMGGTEGFLRIKAEGGLGELACNLDTGHAWARKERVELAPGLLGDSLAGTHLCDNFGHENLKMRPGSGSLDFRAFIAAARASGYAGSWDIEIICAADAVDREYSAGREFVASILAEETGEQHAG